MVCSETEVHDYAYGIVKKTHYINIATLRTSQISRTFNIFVVYIRKGPVFLSRVLFVVYGMVMDYCIMVILSRIFTFIDKAEWSEKLKFKKKKSFWPPLLIWNLWPNIRFTNIDESTKGYIEMTITNCQPSQNQ